MRDIAFRFIAARFPTHRIATNAALAAIWRSLYYTLRPAQPFLMRTADYRLWAHPKRGTLTRAVIRRGHWEPHQTRAFKSFIRPGDFVIDAGANFGHYALTAATLVGRDGLVIAFEPHPATFKLLEANAALLEHRNVVAERAGLGAERGSAAMTIDLANPGGHSLLEGNVWERGETIVVPVRTIDDYLESSGLAERRIALIKIDVQGYEAKVIAGAARAISRHRPVVFCEITPEALRQAGDSPRWLLDFFEARGYAPRLVVPYGRTGSTVNYQTLAVLLGRGEREYWDVAFVPESR